MDSINALNVKKLQIHRTSNIVNKIVNNAFVADHPKTQDY